MTAKEGVFASIYSWLGKVFTAKPSAEPAGESATPIGNTEVPTAPKPAVPTPKEAEKEPIGNTPPICWTSGMSIDGDGSPRAYAPKNSGLPALDYLTNAGEPGNWYGVVTDTGNKDGNPIVQGPHDPATGYYISPTSLQDKSKTTSNPWRYVDSSVVPYIAVPPEVLHKGVKLGDVCWVEYKDKAYGAIVADVGPSGKYGEGSIALAVALGMKSSPKNGGVSSDVTFTVFPGSSKGWPREVSDFHAQAKELFEQSKLS